MISAIIVDDEWAVGQWLDYKLKETGIVEVIHVIQNPLELMECIKNKNIDVVFLDIAMPEITGLELAEQLSILEDPPEVVFVTAYNQFALEAFRVNAIDYVMKPVHDAELQRVLAKITKRIEQRGNRNEDKPKLTVKLKQFVSVLDTKRDFPTAKCEELFFYMLLKGRQPLSKWEIIEDLWPGKDPEKGESNIRTTVFRLNQALDKEGFDLRIKASKGYYHFISSANKSETVVLQPFPPLEDLNEISGSIVEVLQKYNFLQVIEERDYLWAITVKQYEVSFYQWAMEVIERYGKNAFMCLQAFHYLLERFPWQEPLIIQTMPLIFEIEGKGALVRFYKQQQAKWNSLYDTPLSKAVQDVYQSLITNS